MLSKKYNMFLGRVDLKNAPNVGENVKAYILSFFMALKGGR